MRLTVIRSDQIICKDGVCIRLTPWPFDDDDIHAIQWDGTKGEIEVDSQNIPCGEDIVAPYIQAWDAEKLRLDRIKTQEQTAKTFGYKQLRSIFYPPIGDQLDAVYWASKGVLEPQQEVFAKIEEVKQRFPKDMSPISQLELDILLRN